MDFGFACGKLILMTIQRRFIVLAFAFAFPIASAWGNATKMVLMLYHYRSNLAVQQMGVLSISYVSSMGCDIATRAVIRKDFH